MRLRKMGCASNAQGHESESVDGSTALVVSHLMLKLRSCQCVGGPLYNAGAFDRSKEVFLKIIDECLSVAFVKLIPDKMVKVLRGASAMSSRKGVSPRDSVFMLRRSVDILYDHFMNKFCSDVEFYQSRLAMQDIRELLNNAMLLVKEEKFEEAMKVYVGVSKSFVQKWSQILSECSKRMLESGLADAEKAKTSEEACQIMRKCTEYVYDETRVPEEYCGLSVYPEGICIESGAESVCEEMVVVDFSNAYAPDDWEVSLRSDQAINGQSTSLFVAPTADRPFALWYGCVSNLYSNDGGFATIKFVPKFSDVVTISKETLGITMWLRNNSKVNNHFMLSIHPCNARPFHWDSDFRLPLEENFQPIFLPLKYFWPTIFGHSLGLPGQNMSIEGTSVFGLVIAHNLASGKPNLDFRTGEYSLAIQKICLVNRKEKAASCDHIVSAAK